MNDARKYNVEVFVSTPLEDKTFHHYAVSARLLMALRRHYIDKYGESHVEYFHVFSSASRRKIPALSFDLPDEEDERSYLRARFDYC